MAVCLAVILTFPAVAAGQVALGTVQVAGVTGTTNRQTISDTGVDGERAAVATNALVLNLGLEANYFITPHVSVGALVSYQALSVSVSGQPTLVDISAGFYGPMAQLRVPLGDRSSFVLVGSAGGVLTHLDDGHTPAPAGTSSTWLGRYWLAGGGLSFQVAGQASVDIGVRYQRSSFTAPVHQAGSIVADGLLTHIGVSLYFR